MTYLSRSRKSFTLLELMVAFIIMAVLSAVAIPSLINVVGNDQLSADSTSASAIVDAAYLTAESEVGEASPTVTFPITAAEAIAFEPAGTSAAIARIVAASYGDPVPALVVTFTNGDIIYVADPQSDTDPSPATLGGTSPDGGVIGGGSDGHGAPAGTTTTTAPTTTTTVAPTTTTTVANTPSAPTDVVVTPGDSSIVVTWSAPDSDGGSPVTGYTVAYSSDGGATWSSPVAGTSPDTVTGLTNGTSYTVQVVAVNANGSGTESSHVSGSPAAVTDITTAANVDIAITPSGDYGYATGDNNVYKINLATNTVVGTLATGLSNGVYGPIIINHDGTRAYFTSSNGYAIGNQVGVVDLTTFTMDSPITVGVAGVDPAGLAINTAGTRLYVLDNHGSSGEQGSIAVVDLTTASLLTTVTSTSCRAGAFEYISAIGINPADNYLYLSNGSSICGVLDLSDNTLVTPGAYSGSDTTAYIALRGYSESAGPANIVQVDENTGGYQTPLSVSPSLFDVVVSSDGTYAYGTSGNNYYEIDLSTSAVTELGSVTGGANGLAVTPSGTKIYVMKQPGGIKVIPVP